MTRTSPLKTLSRPIPSIIFVVMSILYAFVAWAMWCPILILFLTSGYISISLRRRVHKVASQLTEMFQLMDVALLELFGVNFIDYGDIATINKEENAIIICNHPSLIDWLVLWGFLSRYSQLHRFRVVLKSDLQALPMIGYCIQLSSYIFLLRNWAKDQSTITSLVEYYRNYHQYYNLLIFPEGTNICELSIPSSQRWLDKSKMRGFNELIAPRVTGFIHLLLECTRLNELFDQIEAIPQKTDQIKEFSTENVEKFVDCYSSIDAIYDMTLLYTPTRNWHYVNVFTGTWPVTVHTHLRRIEIVKVLNEILSVDLTTDPNEYYTDPKYNPYLCNTDESREAYKSLSVKEKFTAQTTFWLSQIWYKKDAQLTKFYDQVLEFAVGSNGGSGTNGVITTSSPTTSVATDVTAAIATDVTTSTTAGDAVSTTTSPTGVDGINAIIDQSNNAIASPASSLEDSHQSSSSSPTSSPTSASSPTTFQKNKNFTIPTPSYLIDPLKPHNTVLYDKDTYIINSKPTWYSFLGHFILSINIILSNLALMYYSSYVRWFVLIWVIGSITVLTLLKWPLFSYLVTVSKKHEKLLENKKDIPRDQFTPYQLEEYDFYDEIMNIPCLEGANCIIKFQNEIENGIYNANDDDTQSLFINSSNGTRMRLSQRQIRLQKGAKLNQYYLEKIQKYALSNTPLQSSQQQQQQPQQYEMFSSPTSSSSSSGLNTTTSTFSPGTDASLNLTKNDQITPSTTPIVTPNTFNPDISSRSLGLTTNTPSHHHNLKNSLQNPLTTTATTTIDTTSDPTSSTLNDIDSLVKQHQYNADIYANDSTTIRLSIVGWLTVLQTIVTVAFYLYNNTQ